MFDFLSGMTAAGFLTAALFFFRFWTRTRDSLFANFGGAFVLLAVSQLLSLASDAPHDDKTWIYLVRLAAFTLLLVAIVGKNLKTSKSK